MLSNFMQIVQKYSRQIQIKTKSSGFDFFFFKGKNTDFKEGKKDRIDEKIKRERDVVRKKQGKKERRKEGREGGRKKDCEYMIYLIDKC